MRIHFYKYQGTGNDFVIIDNMDKSIELTVEQVAFLCNRHMGIGADGLMLLEPAEGYDFKMVYYNSDGNESTMCGNGGRCITAFAKKQGVIDNKAYFVAIDGPHDAEIDNEGIVHLAMQDVTGIEVNEGYSILNTGSPHYVKWVDDTDATDVFNEGKGTRNQDRFQPKGINVNFVEVSDSHIKVRTYERGVEDETLSCGTGVTASAIAATGNNTGDFNTPIHTPGGNLRVTFTKHNADSAENVKLIGPATLVFEGDIEI
ncbi:MAG: diaminopimelate epimerase [Chitinophagales bacterium]|nr:diaminopimelate epimerase [Chitinophagaceae bacterium]MCB9063642.1 diaminopimelate epimerase [Chitinophagales bacterium]